MALGGQAAGQNVGHPVGEPAIVLQLVPVFPGHRPEHLGDQQVGAGVAEGRIDFIIFFWDPLAPHPHDVDVKALLRVAVVYNVPIACNRATADFLLSSHLMDEEYERRLPDLDGMI